VPPAQRVEGIPEAVSAIILKLLVKTAEERNQTAAGAERDLRRGLARWETYRCGAKLILTWQSELISVFRAGNGSEWQGDLNAVHGGYSCTGSTFRSGGTWKFQSNPDDGEVEI
jgi:hypothetical protein